MPTIGDKVPATTVMITTADGPGSFGLGTRSEHYAAIPRDGVITSLYVESTFVEHEVSSAEAVLARL